MKLLVCASKKYLFIVDAKRKKGTLLPLGGKSCFQNKPRNFSYFYITSLQAHLTLAEAKRML